MVGPRTCQEHGREVVTSCTWCSKGICESCVEKAQGHKLCGSCALKLSREKPLVRRHRAQEVRNVDHSLTPEQIAEARRRLFPEESKKGPKVRNVPDEWPRLKE